MCQLWGHPHGDVVGKRLFEAVPGMRVQVLKDLLDRVMQTGVTSVGKEVSARLDRDGDDTLEDVYLNFTYAPLHDVGGAIDGVLVMAYDVTDEVHAREQMSELHAASQAAGRAKDNFPRDARPRAAQSARPAADLAAADQEAAARIEDRPSARRDAAPCTSNLARIVDDLLEASARQRGQDRPADRVARHALQREPGGGARAAARSEGREQTIDTVHGS